ncbi:MAG: DNA polymerase III subunit alpha [Anaerofustis stercorihominis]|nr:DNA polymerase III subunit alpha [Anaerofustis stercorihominis]
MIYFFVRSNMMENTFAHLHVHTQFSLLDGFCNIKKLVKKVKELGMTSVAITDHGVMFGVIDFYKECQKQGIKPIIGCEIYMSERSMYQKEGRIDMENYHLVLLAENIEGYRNISKIVSDSYTDGFYRKPRADFDLLRKHSEGVIALTGCIAGKVPQKIIRGQIEEARKDLETLIDIYGKDNLFIEIQDHGMEDERIANETLIKFAQETGVGLVATNDAHYVEKSDAYYHDVLLCVQTAATVNDPKRLKFSGDTFYIRTQEEMEELFSYVPEAITNTGKIAERCNVEFEFHNYHLPKYDVPGGYTAKEYLRKMAFEGIYRRYETVDDELIARLEEELSVIDKMGFNDYILIVYDFIKYAKDNGISVGPGRGSAAGSVACYALGITDIDPIKYALIFERFLNIERVSMPDIDVDFCYENRHKVIEYVIEKYHPENVAQIVTFGTLGAKNAIRDVGRALGMSYADCDKVAKAIPKKLGITIEESLKENPELAQMAEEDEAIGKLIEISMALEGSPRHTSTHAAGVVITDIPIREYVPLYAVDGNLATQFSMTTIEELGLLKMDFLGLRTLTVIKDAVDNVYRSRGIKLDMQTLPVDDPNVYSLISRGDTMGVFQLESGGMRQFLQNLKPDTFEDIIAGIALYRPGPMQYIDTYVANKKDPTGIEYTHIALEPILNVTYGCMVYQEQVMQIVRDLAGYSMGQSDLVRRAMAKKKFDVMQAERKIFVYGDEEKGVMGCVKNGVDEDSANKIFDQMMDFASYAFNKSHAAAYAIVTYQTAYLKTYYPAEFMAALMTSVIGSDEKIAKYIQNLKDMDIDILAPDINDSVQRFSVVDGKVRYGLLALKGLGETAVEEIIQTRDEKGNFTDFADFVKKIPFKSLNKRGVEALIKSGAFDSLGHKRGDLLLIFSDYIDGVTKQRKQNLEGQLSLLDMLGGGEVQQSVSMLPEIRNSRELEQNELLAFEKEALGIYISGHPLNKYKDIMEKHITTDLISLVPNTHDEDDDTNGNDAEDKFAEIEDGLPVIVGALIRSVKTITTKKGDFMAFVEIEDMYSSFEVTIFPRVYEKYSYALKEDAPVLIKGKISKKDESISIIADIIADMRNEDDVYSIKPISKKSAAASVKSAAKRAQERIHAAEETKVKKEAPPKVPEVKKIENIPKGVSVMIMLDRNMNASLNELKDIMKQYPGDVRVIIYNRENKKKYAVPKDLYVTDNMIVVEQMRNSIGKENVKLID